jgi:hypothetical protein
MLEGLKKIDWTKMEIASGSAAPVPAMIRDLVNDDPDAAQEALIALSTSICELGIVFDSSIAAIPFLIEILNSDSAHDPAGILDLLAALAESKDISEVTLPPTHEYQFMPEAGEDYAKDEEEMAWSQQCYDAVAKGMTTYRGLLMYDEPTVRTSAAAMLELFPAAARENAAALQKAIEVEDDIPAMTDLMLSLRDILANAELSADEKATYVSFFRDIFNDEEDVVLRLAGAIALARLDSAAATPPVRDLILDAVINPSAYSAYVGETVENPVHEALQTLVQLPEAERQPFMTRALTETQDPANARSLALTLLVSAFGAEPVKALLERPKRSSALARLAKMQEEQPDVPLRTTLTDEQRDIAALILNSDAFWSTPSQLLYLFGLPPTRNDLLAYLEDPAAFARAG